MSAVASTSFISVGLATDASAYTASAVMFFSVAAQLCSMFVAFLQSPSATLTRASLASGVIWMFSPFTTWSTSAVTCSFASGLNLNTAHLLCIGSMILLL